MLNFTKTASSVVQLSYNISSAIICVNFLRSRVHDVYKYLSKEIDDSLTLAKWLSKYKLLRNSCTFRRNKFINKRRKCLVQRSHQVTKNTLLESYLFPWNLISKEVSFLNKNKLPKCCLQAVGNNRRNTELVKDKSNFISKITTATLQNTGSGMSNDHASSSEKTKTNEDDCITVHDDADHSDAVIVFEKLNSAEIGKDASSSRIRSQSLEKTQILLPEVVTLEDEISVCTFDSNEARRKLLHLNELRQWEYTNVGQECDLSGPPCTNKQYFTVMSYNVLSQDLLENHPYLYYENNPNALTWEMRSERLLEEIKESAPDILCLQEVQESHLKTFYIPRLKELGYDGIYKKRTGNKPDGVAIYFKVSAFSLVEHTSVEFMQPILPVLNRDNVALIARLSSQLAPSLPHLCVATTHLLYNPKRSDVKLAQIQLLLAEIERMAFYTKDSQPSYFPIILTGDLNATPKSSVYRLLTSGSLWDSDVTDEMLDVLGITNNCQHINILNSRLKSEDHSVDRMTELRQLRVWNSDNVAALCKMKSGDESVEEPQEYNPERNRGHLSHNFILNSVYSHRNTRGKEATTKQDRWVTVDYIFYSCSSREKNWMPVEGNLKLVARYGLLSKHECFSYGPIPNLASPSDHFPLMGKFLLLP